MEVAVNLAAEGVSMRRGEQSAATGTRQNTGDIFLMLIQNLIDGTDVQITEGMTELLTSQGDTEEDENLLAGFAGMLLQNPEILPVDILNLVSGNETQASDILESVASGTENPNAAVAAAKLMSMFRDENGQLILPETIDAVETQKPNVEQTAQPTAKTTDAEAMLQIPVTQASYSEQGANASDLMGERQFRNAVSEVKEGLAAGPAKDEHEETTDALDVDSIGTSKPQNIFEYGLKTVAEKKPNEVFGQSLTEQVKTSVDENIALGNKEFTMKLKPESLGEITVRLVEKDGKTVLDITAESAATAKRINEDIAALRDAVRPMAVEVHEATTQKAEAATESELNQQFNMFSQQQQLDGQRHGAYQFGGAGGSEKALNDDFAEAIVENQQETRTLLENELDTYI